jgi:hypothetical protein
MRFSNWVARRCSIGQTARAVAREWKTISDMDPLMIPRDIAAAYINLRYDATSEPHLTEEVLNTLPYKVNPLALAWTIFQVENKEEIEIVFDHMRVWKQIMREEIAKYGIAPE